MSNALLYVRVYVAKRAFAIIVCDPNLMSLTSCVCSRSKHTHQDWLFLIKVLWSILDTDLYVMLELHLVIAFERNSEWHSDFAYTLDTRLDIFQPTHTFIIIFWYVVQKIKYYNCTKSVFLFHGLPREYLKPQFFLNKDLVKSSRH